MSRNGSGTYSLPAGNPVTTGTTISSTWANNTLTDIGTALTQSLAYDGQTTPIANLPMGGFKLTGLGAGSAATDSVRLGQVQGGAATLLSSVSGTNTITATASPTLTAYASGNQFTFVPANTNTGATTINVDSLGAKNLFIGGAACVGGEIRQNVPVTVEYDGTQFNIIGPFVGGNLPTGQLKFPSAQNSSSNANTLDDYAEGTWTPTDASGAGLAGSWTVQSATYTKVGRAVHFQIRVTYPVTANGSNASIGGLPFVPGAQDYAICVYPNTGTAIGGYIPASSQTMSFTNLVGGAAITNANLSGATLRITGTYFQQ